MDIFLRVVNYIGIAAALFMSIFFIYVGIGAPAGDWLIAGCILFATVVFWAKYDSNKIEKSQDNTTPDPAK